MLFQQPISSDSKFLFSSIYRVKRIFGNVQITCEQLFYVTNVLTPAEHCSAVTSARHHSVLHLIIEVVFNTMSPPHTQTLRRTHFIFEIQCRPLQFPDKAALGKIEIY